MQVFCFLFLLFFSVKAFEDNVVKIPLQRHFVSKEKLMERQNVRLSKLGIEKGSLPPYHQKLLESTFRNDYITANISLGTPSQNFQVMLSSGSTRLWILDKEYPSKTSSQHTYNPQNSNTSKNLSKDFFQLDGSFKSFGKYYSDEFQFGHIKINDLIFGSIQKIENKDDDSFLFPVDGVFGLNHLINAVYQNGSELTAPIDNILKNVKKVFTVYLQPYVSPQNGSSQIGRITLGGLDEEHCSRSSSGGFTFSQINGDDRYAISIAYFFYYYNIPIRNLTTAYFDTGVSTIIMPSDAFQLVLYQIVVDFDWDLGIYIYPCDQIGYLQSLYVYYNDNYYITISPSTYIVDLNLGNGKCAVALEMNDGTYKEDFIFGTPLFRNYCVLYDLSANKIKMLSRK